MTETAPWGRPVARYAGALGLIAVAIGGMLATQVRASLAITASVCTVIQVALVVAVIRSSKHTVSVTSAVALVWLITFTLRLVQITVAPDTRYFHPAILTASDATRTWAWLLSTLAFAAFTAGVFAVRHLTRPAVPVDVELPRHAVVALFYVFLGLAYLVAFAGIKSGFVQNVAQLYLFIIAYASYQSATQRQSVGPELVVVLLASMLAIIFGFKEYAVLPVAAWLFGQWTARKRIFSAGAIVVVLIGLFFYVAIQAQRSAEILGEDTHVVTAVRRGLTDYDLATGTYLHKKGLAIPANIGSAIASRLTGVDALFVLHAKVPESVPFVHGKSLWQPLLSTVPGMSHFLAPEFQTLSLGRYTTVTFWSLNPDTDQSSQTLTVVGEFWLNFGTIGVIVGLFAFGLLYAMIDRRTAYSSATMAGLFAYAGIPMLALERNVDYLLLTGAIRYASAFAMIGLMRMWMHRGSAAVAPRELVTA